MEKIGGVEQVRFIVIGCLGSMGRRRIRCLKALGYTDIIGYDIVDYKSANADCWYTDMSEEMESFLKNPANNKPVNAVIVSTPPLSKQKYIDMANKYNAPCFCEADIAAYDGQYYPSRTMIFHPAIRKIKALLDENALGKLYAFAYHCGNHIEDWHPGCDKTTYYAMQKATGGCKEIFAFELSWLSWLFGDPADAKGFIDKKLDDSDISADDVYSAAVKFDSSITGTILIDIVSRPAIRELRIVGEKGTLEWNWNDSKVFIKHAAYAKSIPYERGIAAQGYNENICEQMYVDETKAFIDAVKPKTAAMANGLYAKGILNPRKLYEYPYALEEERKIFDMLRRVEKC